MAKGLFDRYIWLIDTIYRAGKITFEEINKRWLRTEMSNGEEIPLRTFHNHRKAIYNPQIQISAESETKRSIFREKDKTKRSKKESAQHSKSRNKSFVMTSVSAL